MKDKLIFFLPFGYFIKTRVPTVEAFVFHLYYEWIPAFLFLFLFSSDVLTASAQFLTYYFIFICFYELGYLLNDYYSIRFEDSPRVRSGLNKKSFIPFMVLLRLLVFAVLTFYSGLYNNGGFVVFYSILGIVFFLHNLIKKKQFKISTFINLAFLRYLAPFVWSMDGLFLLKIVPSVFLNYVFYRTISYMESKNLLVIEGRKESRFKLVYYAMLLPCSLVLSYFFNDLMPLYINFYYMGFWIIFWMKNNFVPSPND